MTEPVAPPPAPAPAPTPKASRVPVVLSDGRVGTVPEADLPAALRAGATLASEQEVERARLATAAERQFGAFATPAAAAAAGLRGATLGLSDAAIVAAGGDQARETLRGLEASSPVASAVGEFAGNVAPLVLSGGSATGVKGAATAATRAVGAPVRGAAALGQAAERAIVRAEAPGVLGRIAQRTVGGAAAGAVEGAAYGAGKAISEAALENHELTAEELFASIGGMALFGGALGGVSAAPFAVASEGGRALAAGARKGLAAADDIARSARDALPSRAALADGARGAASRAQQVGSDVLESARSAWSKFDGRAIDRKVAEFIDNTVDLQKLSDEQAFRTTYGRKKFTQEAEARLRPGPDGEPGGVEGVGRVLKDRGVIDREASLIDNALSVEDMAPRIESALRTVGEEKGALVRESTATIKVGEVAQRLEKHIKEFDGKAGFEGITGSLRNYRDSLYDKLGAISEKGKLLIGKEVPIQEIVAQRQALDDLVYREAKSLDPNMRVGALRDIRADIAELEKVAMERAGADRKLIEKLNREYQALRIAQDATEDSIARGAANRSIGATDYMAAIGGAAALGPVGAVAGFANKVARERGSASLSVLLEDIHRTKSVAAAFQRAGKDATAALGPMAERARAQLAEATSKLRQAEIMNRVAESTQGFRARVGDAVARVTDTTKSVVADVQRDAFAAGERIVAGAERAGQTAMSVARKASDARRVAINRAYLTADAYEERKRQVEDLSANPETVIAAVQQAIGPVGEAMPQVAAAYATTAQRATQYLKAIMPVSMRDPNSLTPQASLPRPRDLSAPEFAWMRVAMVLDHPDRALDEVADGTLSIDQARALREVYPAFYNAMRTSIIASLAARPASLGPLPYQRTLKLGVLFDAPTTRTLDPDFLQFAQAAYAPQEDSSPFGGISAQRASARQIKLPSMASALDKTMT